MHTVRWFSADQRVAAEWARKHASLQTELVAERRGAEETRARASAAMEQVGAQADRLERMQVMVEEGEEREREAREAMREMEKKMREMEEMIEEREKELEERGKGTEVVKRQEVAAELQVRREGRGGEERE